jgi:hypothetical protein
MTDEDDDRDAIIERWFAEGAHQMNEGPVDIERMTAAFEASFPIIAERIKAAELEDRLAQSATPKIDTVKILLSGGDHAFDVDAPRIVRRYWSDGLIEQDRGGRWEPV